MMQTPKIRRPCCLTVQSLVPCRTSSSRIRCLNSDYSRLRKPSWSDYGTWRIRHHENRKRPTLHLRLFPKRSEPVTTYAPVAFLMRVDPESSNETEGLPYPVAATAMK